MIPNLSTAKLIGFGLGIIAVLGFVALSLHWKAQASDRGQQLATICTVVRDASNNPKLKCADVPKQVALMGESLNATRSALDRQNAAVAALQKASEDQQQKAAQAVQEARQRAKGAEDVSADLLASSRAPERTAKPCEPSAALKEAWK
jgi:hypothetical protein